MDLLSIHFYLLNLRNQETGLKLFFNTDCETNLVMHIDKGQDSKGSKDNSQELEDKHGMRVSSTKV